MRHRFDLSPITFTHLCIYLYYFQTKRKQTKKSQPDVLKLAPIPKTVPGGAFSEPIIR